MILQPVRSGFEMLTMGVYMDDKEWLDADSLFQDAVINLPQVDVFDGPEPLERTTDWLDANGIGWIDYYELVAAFLTAYEYTGIQPNSFIDTLSESAIVSHLNEWPFTTETVSFKDDTAFDRYVLACQTKSVVNQYRRHKDPETTEGWASVLSVNYWELRHKGHVAFIELPNGRYFRDVVAPYLQLFPNIHVLMGEAELSSGYWHSRSYSFWGPYDKRIMVGPFETVGEAVYFKLNLPNR